MTKKVITDFLLFPVFAYVHSCVECAYVYVPRKIYLFFSVFKVRENDDDELKNATAGHTRHRFSLVG